MRYAIVEKKNHLAVHGYFDSKEGAARHLTETIPEIRRAPFLHGQDFDEG